MRQFLTERLHSGISFALLPSVIMFMFLFGVNVPRGQTNTNSERLIKGVYDLYFLDHKPDIAIDSLSKLVTSTRLTYTKDNLTGKILPMLKDYFEPKSDKGRLKYLIRQIGPSHGQTIMSFFSGSSLASDVEDAIASITPSSIKIDPESTATKVGSSTKRFTAKVRNKKGEPLPDIPLRYDVDPKESLEPNGGEFNSQGMMFIAKKSGAATLKVYSVTYKISNEAEIKITDTAQAVTLPPEESRPQVTPQPTIVSLGPIKGPVGSQVVIEGENFDLRVEHDTIMFTGAPTTPDKATTKELTARVPEGAKSGTITVKTPSGQATSTSVFIVSEPLKRPGMKWQLVSSGCFLASGTAFLIFNHRANEKWDEYAQNPRHPEGLYDSYSKALDYKRAALVATAVSGICTGYLWYKYTRDHKEYQRDMSKISSQGGFRLEPNFCGLRIAYVF